jgi:tRNA-splicing ligase RtcB
MINPAGVGYDIACGNMAVRLQNQDGLSDLVVHNIAEIMDTIVDEIAFGVGKENKYPVDHDLFNSSAWHIDAVSPLKETAHKQLGTVGSGNHFVDIFIDDDGSIWIGVHFGSRGLGHKIATHYVKEAGGKQGALAVPALLDENSYAGEEYIAAMNLAGNYAYAGREWVVNKVLDIIGAEAAHTVHNNHNFAWKEKHFGEHLWVVRKGSTPAFPGQYSFIGGSMGDVSVIVKGRETPLSERAMYSTVHGAGRVMSRTEAAGKTKYNKTTKQRERVSDGAISKEDMLSRLKNFGVELRGGGLDEAPQAYRDLATVLQHQKNTIDIVTVLNPIGVAMAGQGV